MKTDFYILSKPGCSACIRAKTAITLAGFTWREDVHETEEQIEKFKALGYRTFPQVFRDDHEYVGTADMTEAYLKNLKEADDF